MPAYGLAPLPVLYSFRRCPYAMRARLALAEAGIACELREVALGNKPPELIEASAKATVPVLVLPSGFVIDQSLDIMRWALQQQDPQGWLVPFSGGDAAIRALVKANDGAFKHHLDRYKYPSRYLAASPRPPDAQELACWHRSSGAGWLQQLDAQLAAHGWLLGTSPSLADMAILPFVRQFAGVDRAWFAAQPWRSLARWLATWESSPLFFQIMEKHRPWVAGEVAIEFPPRCRTAPDLPEWPESKASRYNAGAIDSA